MFICVLNVDKGGRHGSMVERQTPEREVQGLNPMCSVLEQDTLSSPKYW